jgi:hypothetical protein
MVLPKDLLVDLEKGDRTAEHLTSKPVEGGIADNWQAFALSGSLYPVDNLQNTWNQLAAQNQQQYLQSAQQGLQQSAQGSLRNMFGIRRSSW